MSGTFERSDFLNTLPPIFLGSPGVGDSLSGVLHMSGLANVFEAQLNYSLTDDTGKLLSMGIIEATAGTGTWGSFAQNVVYTPTSASSATLHVYDLSAKDGSIIDSVVVHFPLT